MANLPCETSDYDVIQKLKIDLVRRDASLREYFQEQTWNQNHQYSEEIDHFIRDKETEEKFLVSIPQFLSCIRLKWLFDDFTREFSSYLSHYQELLTIHTPEMVSIISLITLMNNPAKCHLNIFQSIREECRQMKQLTFSAIDQAMRE